MNGVPDRPMHGSLEGGMNGYSLPSDSDHLAL